jgi:hypothetical protein
MEKLTRKKVAEFYGVSLRTFYRNGGLETYPVPEQFKDLEMQDSRLKEFPKKILLSPEFLRARYYKFAKELIAEAQRELCW